jgi:hypothetical protein
MAEHHTNNVANMHANLDLQLAFHLIVCSWFCPALGVVYNGNRLSGTALDAAF